MTLLPIATVPNRPLGSQPRSIADILGDFDHITNYINNSIVPEINAPSIEFQDVFQQGVISGNAPTRDSSTQVTIPAGVGYITQVDGTRKRVSWSDTTIGSIPAGVANGRVDQFVVDSTGSVTRLAGSNAASAIVNLDDANATASRAAVPTGSMRLFEVVVDNTGVLSTAGTKVRDRRAWAKGAFASVAKTSGDFSSSSTSYVAIDSSTFALRVECSGKPLRIRLNASIMTGTAGVAVYSMLRQDGVNLTGGSDTTPGLNNFLFSNICAYGSNLFPFDLDYLFTPAAGSHLFVPYWAVSSSNVTMRSTTTSPAVFSIEELDRPPANNGTA